MFDDPKRSAPRLIDMADRPPASFSSPWLGGWNPVDERSAGLRVRDVLQGRVRDRGQSLLGEERLMTRDQDVREREKALEHVVVGDFVGDVLKKQICLH